RLRRVADRGDDAGTACGGELHARGPEAAGRAEHEDGLARRDLAAAVDRVVAGVGGDEERGRLLVAQLRRRDEEAAPDGDRDVGEAAPRLDAHADDPIPTR